jgi:hypothetical protein
MRAHWPQRQRDALLHARQAMKKATERVKRHFDQRRRRLVLSPGDRVLLNTKNLSFGATSSSKLTPRFIGPFAVEERVGNVCYKLALPETMKVHPVFHVELLRQYKGPDFTPPSPLECEDGSVRYVVERLISSRGHGPKRQYLVRWEGYDPAWDSWEPRDLLLEDAPELVSAFDAHHRLEPRTRVGAAEPRATGRRRRRKRSKD